LVTLPDPLPTGGNGQHIPSPLLFPRLLGATLSERLWNQCFGCLGIGPDHKVGCQLPDAMRTFLLDAGRTINPERGVVHKPKEIAKVILFSRISRISNSKKELPVVRM